MSVLTQDQLDGLRKRLGDERASLQADMAAIENQDLDAGHEYDEESSSLSNHPAESGTETFEQERGLSIDLTFQGQLVLVERALAKMDEGTYGVCDVGGEEIPLERLEALPYAVLCLKHQELQDAEHPS